MDVFNWIDVGATLSLVGLCWKMTADKNGRYVRKDVCEVLHRETKIEFDSSRNILENKIIELKDDIIEIKADVKTILRNNKHKE